jgi:Fe-S-cluster-containing dehydrogenase component
MNNVFSTETSVKNDMSEKGKLKSPDTLKTEYSGERREFLKRLGLVGAAVTIGSGAIYSGYKYQQKKDMVTIPNPEGGLQQISKEQLKELKPDNTILAQRGRKGIPGKRWVMVIDLSKCKNARACIKACQSAHDLRPYEYHINTLVMQDKADSEPYFMPKPCQHCDNPPCVSVCPVDATFKRQDGIVLIDNERCIGCRFCMAACPYSARMFHWEEPLKAAEYRKNKEEYKHAFEHGELDKARDLKKLLEYDVEQNIPQRKGTISKCLFSADKLRKGQLPSCVSNCPNGVYYFGNENEDAVTNGTTKETVRLSTLLKENTGYQLMPELGTKPRVYYLPRKGNAVPKDQAGPLLQNDSHA